jgi:NlpC/P60 family putative phage cell wall peptidase
MIEASAVIAEARTWKGTRFHHQAAVKGVGVDCVGLITGTGAAFGWRPDPDQFRRFRNYARVPNPTRMLEALNLFLRPVPEGQMQLADVFYMQWREDVPTHLAILSEFDGRPTIIHAWSEAGAVVEHGYVDPWPDRLHSVWRYPFL